MIRPLTADDVPGIPSLLATDRPANAEAMRRVHEVIEHLFPRLFLKVPTREPDIHGLVSETESGQLTGMIGTVARRMEFRGQPIRAAVSAELFVDPKYRSQMLGVKLLRRIMKGPQDLLISDIANESSRKIWEYLGGCVATPFQLNWVKVLRPGLWPLTFFRSSRIGRAAAWAATPVARLADRIARHVFSGISELRTAPTADEELLTPELFLELFPKFCDDELRPVYDAPMVSWIWNRLEFMYRDGGRSHQVLLRTPQGEPLGWYIYQQSDTGLVRVSQIMASAKTFGAVLDHLLRRVAVEGAVAVIGRVPPRFLQSLLDRRCMLARRSTYTLVHSRNSELAKAFVEGRAFLSLLEGEGPLQIWNNPQLALQRLRQDDGYLKRKLTPALSS